MYEKLAALADRISETKVQCETEEATKTALILPFIRELGYDVFNPAEVIPEFTADVGIKRGEKVDYAICLSGCPIILVEAKTVGTNLDSYSSQLYRYFSTTKARIAILTDGLVYRFYSDLKEPNKLDNVPFFSFSFERFKTDDAARLVHFSKQQFDIETVLAHAETQQIMTGIRAHFAREMKEPSDAFVRHFADPIHDGRMMQTVIDQYRSLVKLSIAEFISEAVESRLHAALKSTRIETDHAETANSDTPAGNTENSASEEEVVTTLEELHGFYSVKAILRDLVDPSRIAARDVQSYFGILLDDNNRKPICRLWFNRSQKYLGVFDASKDEIRIPIKSVDEVFAHTDQIRESLQHVL